MASRVHCMSDWASCIKQGAVHEHSDAAALFTPPALAGLVLQ
jgi:hypothetical protein